MITQKDQLRKELRNGSLKCFYCGNTAYYEISKGRLCCSERAYDCPNYHQFDGDRKRQMYADNPEMIEKQREVGKINHNRPEVIEKKRQSMLKLHHEDEGFIKKYRNGIQHAKETKNTPEYVEKAREISLERCKDPEYRKRYFKKITTEFNGEERCVLELLNQLFPRMFKFNYKDNPTRIDNLRPDFISKNNKICIDYFGSQYHLKNCEKLNITPEEYAQIRIDRLAKKGWKELIIWREDLIKNREEVIKRIINFVDSNRVF
jgi:very-short-patch-repair endonuclease